MTKKVDKAAEQAAAEAAKATEDAAAAEAAKAGDEDEGLDITGKVLSVRAAASRRRAGRAFGPEPVEIAADELSEDEIGAILSDPQLSVTLI